MMHVRAKADGFFGGRQVAPGDVFELEETRQFSHLWMEPIGWEPPPPRIIRVMRKRSIPSGRKIDYVIILLEAMVRAMPKEAFDKVCAEIEPYGVTDLREQDGGREVSIMDLAADQGRLVGEEPVEEGGEDPISNAKPVGAEGRKRKAS